MNTPTNRLADHRAAQSALRVRVLRDRGEVEQLAPEWCSLAERTQQDFTAFPAWVLGCFDLEPRFEQARLRVVTVRHGDELVGVGPFVENRHAGLRIVRFSGLWMGQTNRLIVAPGDEPAASAIWSALRTPGTYLELQALDEDFGRPTLEGSGRWATRTEMTSVCRVIDTTQPFEQMLQTPDRRSLRRVISAASNRATHDGMTLGEQIGHGLDGLSRLLPQIQAVEATAEGAWHSGGIHADLAAGRIPELLRRVATEALVVTNVVTAGNRPIAYLISLAGTGRVIAFVNGHDPESRRYNPGHLAFAAIYEFAHENGSRSVDLSLGDLEYKHRWTEETYGVTTVMAAPHRAGLELTRTAQSVRSRVHESVGAATRSRVLRRSA